MDMKMSPVSGPLYCISSPVLIGCGCSSSKRGFNWANEMVIWYVPLRSQTLSHTGAGVLSQPC
ncbi:hypothetical protein BJY04DRAFT_198318 [Aspergillus karnatakaensis]|uniref:uncharacterized protein n=1 Tax=Aspergillus karnatakaensis TaxID=1810916 RepID=UPI003CCD844B